MSNILNADVGKVKGFFGTLLTIALTQLKLLINSLKLSFRLKQYTLFFT